jgi:hypothetical protein
LLTDKRGVTALMFALTAAAILGVVGLATEVGAWYLARAQAQNAADAAAIAASLASVNGTDPAAEAENVVSRNGLTKARVTPIVLTPDGSNLAATQVTVSMDFSPLLASLFTRSTVTVSAAAMGIVGPVGSRNPNPYACALSLDGNLLITQNQNALGIVSCFYASNAADPEATGVIIAGAVDTFQAAGITTTKRVSLPPGCGSNCPNLTGSLLLSGSLDSSQPFFLGRPYASFQPPTTNPFNAIDARFELTPSQIVCPAGLPYPPGTAVYPSTGGNANCPRKAGTPVTITTLVPSAGDSLVEGVANPKPTCPAPLAGKYCGYYNMNLTIQAGGTVTLAPEAGLSDAGANTYLFVDSSLTVPGGTTIQCVENLPHVGSTFCSTTAATGVTFVLTGTPVSEFTGRPVTSLTIAAGANANLTAPATNNFPGAPDNVLGGILFYHPATAANHENAVLPGVVIADTTGNVFLSGAMYFPRSHVYYVANTNVNIFPQCSVIVAGYLTLGFPPGFSDEQPNPTQFSAGCSAALLPGLQAAMVVQ